MKKGAIPHFKNILNMKMSHIIENPITSFVDQDKII